MFGSCDFGENKINLFLFSIAVTSVFQVKKLIFFSKKIDFLEQIKKIYIKKLIFFDTKYYFSPISLKPKNATYNFISLFSNYISFIFIYHYFSPLDQMHSKFQFYLIIFPCFLLQDYGQFLLCSIPLVERKAVCTWLFLLLVIALQCLCH